MARPATYVWVSCPCDFPSFPSPSPITFTYIHR
jgi:hypothetical protein